jgi:hypothetical protein
MINIIILSPPTSSINSKQGIFYLESFNHSSTTTGSGYSMLDAVDRPYPTVKRGSAILGTVPSAS